MNRRLTALALVMGMVTVLSGCTLLAAPPQRSATPIPADKDGYYSQSLQWEKCGTGLECATAKAPVNWNSPTDGSIDLALVKHPATGTAQGSLLLNPGGPGGSGWDYVFSSGAASATAAVAKNFDLVGWDPRGVGRSTPVVCFTDPQQTDKALYGTYDSAYDTQGWIDALTTEEQSFAAACEKNTGELLGNVDTASNAKDMDMLRAVLGDDKLNYLGYSYGTYFGTVYAELFPDKVGRFVLDGAVDPLVSDFESLKFQMAGFDSGFRAYLTKCLSGPDCFFQGTVDDAAAQARSALDNIDALAFRNADGRVLDSATLATGILSKLYSESAWPDLTAMFASLAKGDPGPTFASADSYNSRNADGTYQSNSYEVYVAATCVDGDFVDDPASTLDRIAQIDAAAPILVIGTTNDPATPYASAVSLARQLSSGVLITHRGEGHTVYNQGVTCIDDAVDNYFVNGTVPAADPMC